MVKKLITLDGLAVFLSELRKEINAGSGKCFDAEELARRIPSWQWKGTMPKTVNQTVTATVGTQTYTDDFYAPQGSAVTFSVKADDGYIAGTLSATNAKLDNDLAVTVTDAEVSEELTAGSISFSPEYFENRNDFEFEVPPKVKVLRLDTNVPRLPDETEMPKDGIYFKVVPGTKMIWGGDLAQSRRIRMINAVNYIKINPPIYVTNLIFDRDKEFTFSWSNEINSHGTDMDLTELGNKWVIDLSTHQILVPDRFNVLKVEMGDKVKYVKLREKRRLEVFFASELNLIDIENKRIFYLDDGTRKNCSVSWGDEIDAHTPDIEL